MVISQRVKRLLGGAVLATAALCPALARADVKLPAVLSDHMVLQQGIAVPVWGWADPDEQVTVKFANDQQTAKADAKGHWEVKLAPLTACAKPRDLAITGKNKIELKDILVGEVWVCSGQSNMEFSLNSAKNHEQEIKDANYPEIRLFTVVKSVKTMPQSDTMDHKGAWAACTPETSPGFTAVGYFFGRDLYKDLKVPVGLIHSSWGGTPAESWTPHKYLVDDSDLRVIEANWDKRVGSYPADKAKFEADAPKIIAKWEEQVAKIKAENEKLKAEGKKPKQLPRKPAAPTDPAADPHGPSVLYNGMIAPIVPYAIKGAIWYQGESNSGRAWQYRKLLPTMIKSWRDAWCEPNLDFYIVSLANFQQPAKEPGDDAWAELRKAQSLTAAMPHNGQALAIDLADADDPGNIHPHNKQDVGHRLELVALAKSYCKTVDYSGPEYNHLKIEGDKVVIHFNFNEGLTAKGGEPLKGFQIAGEDKKWHWADAKIAGKTVVVWSKDVPMPSAVRYDWSINPQGNLYNKADLPTAPFRTDDWPAITMDKK